MTVFRGGRATRVLSRQTPYLRLYHGILVLQLITGCASAALAVGARGRYYSAGGAAMHATVVIVGRAAA
jgi:hypothetical protein